MPLPFRFSRRSLLKAAARLGVGAALAGLGIGGGEPGSAEDESGGGYFRESANRLTLGNQYYEVDFDKRNGAITRIFDKRGGGVVSEGNADGSLWALLSGGWWEDGRGPKPLQSWLKANQVARKEFQWSWSKETNTLILEYWLSRTSVDASILVMVSVNHGPFVDFSARVDNRDGPTIDAIDFPSHLAFKSGSVQRAVLPYMGGVALNGTAFRDQQWFVSRYPEWTAMADLLWIETHGGKIAIYAVHDESDDWLAHLAIGHYDDSEGGKSFWRHAFALALGPHATISLPSMRIRFASSPLEALSAWRQDNRIDKYDSVRNKLGDSYETVRHAPTSPAFHSWYPITNLEAIDPPVILHPFGFQEGETWSNHPDWWPPGPQHGGTAGYLNLYGSAQRDGMLVMPYTWTFVATSDSQTASALEAEGLALDHLAVQTVDKSSLRLHGPHENYQKWFTNASPSSKWYLQRLDRIMADHDIANHDLVYEDQLGAVSWVYDRHPDADSPLRFAHRWLLHTQQYAHRHLTTEGMYDRMCRYVVAGYYSMLLREDAGWMAWPSGTWSYFPAAAAMFRDTTLQFGHNLLGISQMVGGIQPYADNDRSGTEVLRFSLVNGLLLTQAVPGPSHPQGSNWLPVATSFSHHVLGPYADELLTDFRGNQDEMTESIFMSVTVTANWTEQPMPVGEHTLVPNGVVSIAHDGSVTGGVFQRYNGRALSPDEHYLIEQRKRQGIIVRQPMGTDTPITVHALDSFGASVALTAFNRHHLPLRRTSARRRQSQITFSYDGVAVDATDRREFEASVELGADNQEDGLKEAVIPWKRSFAVEHEGRGGRRPPINEEGFGPLAFSFTRRIIEPEGGDVAIAVDFFAEQEVDDWLGVSYDGIRGKEEQSWQGPLVRDGAWKTLTYKLPNAAFHGRQWGSYEVDFTLWVPRGVLIGKITVTNADELERRTVAYYTIHDPTQGETLTQGLHLRGWTDATQPIADLDLDGLAAIFAWDAEGEHWLMHSPHVPTELNTLQQLEQGRAYYVRVANGRTLHWPEAPYGGNGFLLQPGRNLVCWLGTPDKPLTDAIAPLRGMKAEPLVSVNLNDVTYDVEGSRAASEPLAYGQAVWVEIDAVGPTRWLQF